MSHPLQPLIEKLTGQKIPLEENVSVLEKIKPNDFELGYSQLNELLLILGYDRVSRSFFRFLVDGKLEYDHNAVIHTVEEFTKYINKIVEFSLRLFGNIKFGYKQLSSEANEEEFKEWYEAFQPIQDTHYTKRHPPLFGLNKIKSDDTYFLGYVIRKEINEKLSAEPQNLEYQAMKSKMEEIVMSGIENHKAYLASDHMDVYVATSMRHRHEYLFISRIADQIFNDSALKDLKVRYFDPTQAYCSDRIDKGIAEALMLKRARCTIYLAQESDTLGKDSELASTLAQGKTVVAYIPKGDCEYVNELLNDLEKVHHSKSRKEIIVEQLKIFDPELCWTNKQLRSWIDSDTHDDNFGMELLYSSVERKYNSRAQTLKEIHPLGIQVNLETGVANGVIVTREINECAMLVRKVLLGELEFDVVEETREGIPYVLLKESITKSVYRVSTGERLLTNTFWNFYLPK